MKSIKFLVFTDLHQGNIMPDAKERFENIIGVAKAEEVNFIVNLGDFISNLKEPNAVGDMWHGLEIPHYIVPGNHDFDLNDEMDFKTFYALDQTYYCFEDSLFCYIVLDTNFFRKDGVDQHYAYGNYYGMQREYVSQDQLSWLAQCVHTTRKRCIVMSHAQLNYPAEQGHGGCGNYQEVHQLLVALNEEAGYPKICLAINGHNHTDSYMCWDNIHYLDINSASNQWLGEGCVLLEPNEIYTEAAHESYPYLKYVAPYEEALYALITYDVAQNQFNIQGKESRFIGPTPQERRHEGTMGGITICPKITHRQINLDKQEEL
ncbi:MAG: metallophosphoesterase family protein [Cellulosilyticaceae bacterium]